MSIFDKHIPKKKSTTNSYPPWVNGCIIYKIKQKHKAWKNYKSSGSVDVYNSFKLLRREIKYETKMAYELYIGTVELNLQTNPNKFWSFLNIENNRSTISSILTYDNVVITDPHQIVDSFTDYFASAFTDPTVNLPTIPVHTYCRSLDINTVTEEDVLQAIKKIKPNMTVGPDSVPAFINKDCSHVFAKPLSTIFNIILKTSCFPDIWKRSRICPIYKKGDKNDIANHRPITIISHFSKILEIILHSVIAGQVSGMLSNNQHGFMKDRSTVTNLVCETQFL